MNECETDNGGCAQICTNVFGSFECSCSAGYTLAADNLGCDGKNIMALALRMNIGIIFCLFTDVDECLSNNGGCETICVNNNGSFLCSCDIGYTLSANNLNCEGKDKDNLTPIKQMGCS